MTTRRKRRTAIVILTSAAIAFLIAVGFVDGWQVPVGLIGVAVIGYAIVWSIQQLTETHYD